MFRYRYWVLAVLAVLSRVLFVDGGVDWFDSPQYLARSQDASLLGALSTGHAPFHPGYILWTWLAVHGLSWTHASPAYLMSLTTALFGAGALVVFFALAERWTNPRVAALATLLAGLTPFLWVGSIGILIDPVMVFWYLLALFLFDIGIEQLTLERDLGAATYESRRTNFGPKTISHVRTSYVVLLTSGLALGLAMLAHTQIALWGLGFVAAAMVRWHSNLPTLRSLVRLLPFVVGPLLAIGVYLWLLVHAGHNSSYREALTYLLGGNAGEHAPFSLAFAWRNWRAVAGSSLALVSLVAFGWLVIQRSRLGLALLICFLPGLIVSASYLYSNLYGRSSTMAVFPAALATSLMLLEIRNPKRQKTNEAPSTKFRISKLGLWNSFVIWKLSFVILLVAVLLAQSLPLVWGYGHGQSIAEEQGAAQRLLGGAYVLESGENITFRGTDRYDVVQVASENEIQTHVRDRLAVGESVYLSSDAWRWPFAKLDGRNLRIDSLAFNGPGEHGSAVAYLADMGVLTLAQLAPSELPWSTYQLASAGKTSEVSESLTSEVKEAAVRALSLFDRVHHAANLLERSGNHQTVIVSRFVSAGQPVGHLLVDLYPDRFVHASRFDAGDWLVRSWQRLANRRDPLTWSYTDVDGVAELAFPRSESPHLEAIVASTDRLHTAPMIQASTGKTVATDHRSISPYEGQSQSFSSFTELQRAIVALPATRSAIVKLQDRSGDRVDARLWTFDYQLPLTDTIEAEDLSLSDAATVVRRQSASNGLEVRFAPHASGTVLYGPYRTLPGGHYQIKYAFAVPADADPLWQLATLQAAGELEGRHLVTSEPITVADVRRGPIALEFTLDQPTNFIEFRVLPLGAPTSFTIDTLTLTRVDK